MWLWEIGALGNPEGTGPWHGILGQWPRPSAGFARAGADGNKGFAWGPPIWREIWPNHWKSYFFDGFWDGGANLLEIWEIGLGVLEGFGPSFTGAGPWPKKYLFKIIFTMFFIFFCYFPKDLYCVNSYLSHVDAQELRMQPWRVWNIFRGPD